MSLTDKINDMITASEASAKYLRDAARDLPARIVSTTLVHAMSLGMVLPIMTPRYLSRECESTMLMLSGCGSIGGLSIHCPRYMRSVLSRLITIPDALQNVSTMSREVYISGT